MFPGPLSRVLLLVGLVGGCRPDLPSADPVATEDPHHLAGEHHFVDGYAPRDPQGRARVVVEIPAGTCAKWEVDKSDGVLKWEVRDGRPRVVQYLGYPGNYGMVPRTLLAAEDGGDGDPLDVLVLGPALERGAVVSAHVIGVLRLLDGGERDDKLLAVPGEGPFAEVRDLAQLRERFPGVLGIVETWFTSYKGPGVMDSAGFADRGAAEALLDTAIQTYAAHRDAAGEP